MVDQRKEKTVACIRPGIASAGGSFPQEDAREKYMRCGRRALLLLLWHLSPLLNGAVVLVRNWQI